MYKELSVDFHLPEIIKEDISGLLQYLNNGGEWPDCHIENLRSDLNSFAEDFTEEQIQILKNYYCRGGIYG